MANFTEADMAAVVESFYTATTAMMAAEQGGTRREFPVMVAAMNELGSQYPDSAIVQALLASNPSSRQAQVESALTGSTGALQDAALAAVKHAAQVIASLAPDELATYQDAVLHVLDKVADAAGELGYFGSEGAGVSEGEAKFLDLIKAAMQ